MAAQDAVQAFGELGTSVDELKDYCTTESRDMARYSVSSAKRVEDLTDFKGTYLLIVFAACPYIRVVSPTCHWALTRR